MTDTIGFFEGEYRFLSNFHYCPIAAFNSTWTANEHAYQAAKTEDPAEQRYVAESPTAGIAKRRGGKVTIRSDWELIKNTVMAHLVAQKFAEGTEMAQMLLDTGEAVLIEGNKWHDNYWGDCVGGQPKCVPECELPGRNELGKLLMYRRFALRGSF